VSLDTERPSDAAAGKPKPPPPILAPADATRLLDFARACRAAARAVSLYPGGHPTIRLTLTRLAEVSSALTGRGAYALQVGPDTLTIDGAGIAKPDPAAGELAGILHRHAVGALTLTAGADVDSWRTFLLLVARAPEEVRADGGIRLLWERAGGPSIEVHEIDYAEVLKDRGGEAATLDAILAACLKGTPQLELDDAALQLLAQLANDPERLAELTAKLQDEAAAAGPSSQASVFLKMLRGVAEYLARTHPDRLDTVFRNIATVAARYLAPDVLAELLAQRSSDAAHAGGTNVVAAVVDRMNDGAVAEFVARAVIEDRGASARLAEAFQALVPDTDRQRRLVATAGTQVAASPLGQDENFPNLWGEVEKMLTSYSDERFVAQPYARELSMARTQAIEIERATDDPPERIGEWLSTVADAALRSLDLRLLVDLLTVEQDAAKWRGLADTVVSHVDGLVQAGHIASASALLDVVAQEAAQAGSARQPIAEDALKRIGAGPMMGHALAHVRAADDQQFELIRRLCHTLGPVVVNALAAALASETDARARRRLREILLAFGALGRESVRQLMSSTNWEVRRTAAYLLREFGGSDALTALEPLLNDAEPLVQREAIQALILIGDQQAFDVLTKALQSGTARSRQTLVQELQATRDERAAPLFSYLLAHVAPRGPLRGVYEGAVETLGAIGGPIAIDALKKALHRGEWWAPRRTRALRAAAATALRRIGTPQAVDVLRDAVNRGSRGVRSAALSELRRVADQPEPRGARGAG